jgi:hypothetical protein
MHRVFNAKGLECPGAGRKVTAPAGIPGGDFDGNVEVVTQGKRKGSCAPRQSPHLIRDQRVEVSIRDFPSGTLVAPQPAEF